MTWPCPLASQGLLSVVYLKRKQYGYHWVAMLLVVAGVLTVGTASILSVSAHAATQLRNGAQLKSHGSSHSGGSPRVTRLCSTCVAGGGDDDGGG